MGVALPPAGSRLARVAGRWRAAAASLALVAAGLGVYSTMSRTPPRVAEVAGRTEPAREKPREAGPAEGGRGRDNPRREGLLASSSWTQVRASLDSVPRTVEVDGAPRRPRAGPC